MRAPPTPLLPGDFEVCTIAGVGGALISFGEWANGGSAFTTWDHARIYLGDGQWLEAEPNGARIVSLGHAPTPGGLCSVNLPGLALPSGQLSRVWPAGKALENTPYSGLDYLALAAHRLHIPAPGLNRYIASSGHMMCSQLVDHLRLSLGSHLFGDGRPEGYVTPWDLGHLIQGYGGTTTPPLAA